MARSFYYFSTSTTTPETEAIERQQAYVGDAIFCHQSPCNFPKEFGAFAGRNVLVVNLAVKPGDQTFQCPVVGAA
jgi:hypothetical protein